MADSEELKTMHTWMQPLRMDNGRARSDWRGSFGEGDNKIHSSFPSQGEERRAHEGSQSSPPSKDTPSREYNQ